MKLNTLFYVALVLELFAGTAFCQKNTAPPNLSGTIVDLTGAPIAQAHIWIYEEHGDPSFTVESDRSGLFAIQLPNGHYDVMIGSPGFLPFCKLVSVQQGKPIELKVRLRVDPERITD